MCEVRMHCHFETIHLSFDPNTRHITMPTYTHRTSTICFPLTWHKDLESARLHVLAYMMCKYGRGSLMIFGIASIDPPLMRAYSACVRGIL